MGNRLRSVLIVFIVMVWGGSYALPIFVHSYSPPSQLSPTALAFIGLLIASYKKEDNNDKE